MFGVIGNRMIWRLIGMRLCDSVCAKIPSVGLTSQRSSFCSADEAVLRGGNALPLVVLDRRVSTEWLT